MKETIALILLVVVAILLRHNLKSIQIDRCHKARNENVTLSQFETLGCTLIK